MIITLTLNPAIDHAVTLEEFVPEDANRIVSSRSDPGGKGINVSRVLLELGCETLAMGFVSGSRGRFLEQGLRELGIYTDFIHTPGQTRTNITIIDRKNNTTTSLNERGPVTTQHHVHLLYQKLKRQLTPGDWLVIGGSIPPGLDAGLYGEIISFAKERGAHCVLDADGRALTLGIAARPFLVKPNRTEVERILGAKPRHRVSLLDAAQRIHQGGAEVVVLSQGSWGATLVSDDGCWRVYPPPVPAVSTVGTGDAMVAGLVQMLSQGGSMPEALRLGAAAGAAAALTEGTQLCHQADVLRLISQIQVHSIETLPATPEPAMAGARVR